MRAALDKLYDAAAWLAAFMMIGTLLMVVLGMLDRYVSLNFRGTDMYAGYCMAGAGFLALAHTLKKNEHIRVTLLLNAVSPGTKRALEIWSLCAAVLLSSVWAFVFTYGMLWQRCHAAMDSPDWHGAGHAGAADRLC